MAVGCSVLTSTSFGMRTLFLRYNPDKYTTQGKRGDDALEKREQMLIAWIRHWMENQPDWPIVRQPSVAEDPCVDADAEEEACAADSSTDVLAIAVMEQRFYYDDWTGVPVPPIEVLLPVYARHD